MKFVEMGSLETSMSSFSQDVDSEYEKLIRRMNPPRVVIDNETCKDVTVIQVINLLVEGDPCLEHSVVAILVQVDSANKHGILLQVVQILTDLNLNITKAYISSDGGWFMDVFSVTDEDGNKVTDEKVVDYIHKSLGSVSSFTARSAGMLPSAEYTSIDLIGRDRPGLLSEVSAVLSNLKCNVVNADMWTHNTRAAAVIQVADQDTGCAIHDPERISTIKKLLCNVVRGSMRCREPKMVVSHHDSVHTDRRLHRMMCADRDYERMDDEEVVERQRPDVSVVNWYDKDYSIVTVRCKDRPKLLFDTICTLTDMQYAIFHGSVDSDGPGAYQEYYIRHVDGSPVKSEAEGQRVIQCLEAAIERRVSEGLKLEVCTADRVGLLSDVTRIFRENGLTVCRAEVRTRAGQAVDAFYVRDASGYPVDSKTIESIRGAIGHGILKVKGTYEEESKQVHRQEPQHQYYSRFLFGGLFKSSSI